MPRILSKKKDYMAKDIGPWIAGRMRMKRLTQQHMARCLGISQPAFGKKLATGHLTYTDMLTILHELDATDDEIIKIMKY